MKRALSASSCSRRFDRFVLWFRYQLWFQSEAIHRQTSDSKVEHPKTNRLASTLFMAACIVVPMGGTVGGAVKPAQAQSLQLQSLQPQSVSQPISQLVSQPVQNPTIQVGVVQRFAEKPSDVMLLKPVAGDRLMLRFKDGSQDKVITTTEPVKVEVVAQPLAAPQVTEQVVLSTHRSFESAEDSANQWRAKGIEVEIAQPQQWQVWAKRETYRSPLLRRLLMQNLRANGARTAFLDSQVARQDLKAAVVIAGFRYQREEVEVNSGTNRVEVTFNRDDHGRRLYGGNVKLQPNAYGDYTLVNHVPIETYLRGVVPHEIGLGAPPTAIEAQAILARTYALRNLRRFAIDNYQLCADTQCQVYWGLNGADPLSDRAIDATSGLVLAYQNELVDALYSSTTGGITAPFHDVWNGSTRPYLTAVVDSVNHIWDLNRNSLADERNFRAFISQKQGFNEVGWDMFRWRVTNTMAEIAQDVKAYLQSKQHPFANFTQIQALEISERSPAGRVLKMTITTDRGSLQLEKDEILRALYAPNSTLFYLEPIYDPAPSSRSTTTNSNPANSNLANSNPANPNPANPQGLQPPAPSNKVDAKQATPEKITVEQASELGKPRNQPEQAAIAQMPSMPPAARLKGYAFIGGGFGHGVGMSQTGAYRLGKLGWSNQQILSFYFPGAQVVPLSGSVTFWRNPSQR